MEYYLADGTKYEPGLYVTKTDNCPGSKWAFRLISGVTTGEIEDERGDAKCMVEGVAIESGTIWRPGSKKACLLKFLQLDPARYIKFDESEFLGLIGGEIHETC